MKNYSIQFQQSVRPAIRVLYLLAFVQFITVGPYLVITTIKSTSNSNTDNVMMRFCAVFVNLSGFFNACIYMFNTPKNMDLDEDSLNSNELKRGNSTL